MEVWQTLRTCSMTLSSQKAVGGFAAGGLDGLLVFLADVLDVAQPVVAQTEAVAAECGQTPLQP